MSSSEYALLLNWIDNNLVPRAEKDSHEDIEAALALGATELLVNRRLRDPDLRPKL